MKQCSKNRFCNELQAETRDKLCNCCMLTTYASGSEAIMNFNNAFLVLDGLCAIYRDDYLVMVVRPGDLIVPPRVTDDSPVNFRNLLEEPDDVEAETSISFVTDTTFAVFRQKSIERLLEHDDSKSLLQAMYDNLRDLSSHMTAYRLALSHPAHKAVLYALDFCKAYGFCNLTHSQLALLTNRNRSTVTQVMHRIAASQPKRP